MNLIKVLNQFKNELAQKDINEIETLRDLAWREENLQEKFQLKEKSKLLLDLKEFGIDDFDARPLQNHIIISMKEYKENGFHGFSFFRFHDLLDFPRAQAFASSENNQTLLCFDLYFEDFTHKGLKTILTTLLKDESTANGELFYEVTNNDGFVFLATIEKPLDENTMTAHGGVLIHLKYSIKWGIGHEDYNDVLIETIFELLMCKKPLRHVNLGGLICRDQGALLLAEALCVNDTLEYLNLENNRITSVGGEALGKALLSNFSLKHLVLTGNYIGMILTGNSLDFAPETIKFTIGEALCVNTTLKHLGLKNNYLKKYQELEVIALSLCKNNTLRSLQISTPIFFPWSSQHSSQNMWDDKTGKMLETALEENYSLVELDGLDFLSEQTRQNIENILKRNLIWEKKRKEGFEKTLCFYPILKEDRDMFSTFFHYIIKNL